VLTRSGWRLSPVDEGAKLKTLKLIAVVAIALLALVALILSRTERRSNEGSSKAPGSFKEPAAAQRQQSQAPSSTSRNLGARILGSIDALQKSNSPDRSKGILMELGAALLSNPKEEASKAIQEILSTGIDFQTHLDFEVGAGGRLSGASTFRVFLLDYLGHIDPAAAAELARSILSKLEAPDEWAVSLRNYARANSSADSLNFLRDRLRALLTHEPWQENPSAGYLEAFDAIVHLGGSQLMPELTQLLRLTNNQAVAHAAFLATDRLVINDPVPVLTALANEASLMQGRELARAGYFSRADISNLDQRGLVEKYLLNLAIKPDELEAFADLFPNENYRISQNLLTTTPPRPGHVIQQRDREALRVVENWMTQDRFKEIRPQLQTIQNRLQAFTRSSR
jgi:hypothetical protein